MDLNLCNKQILLANGIVNTDDKTTASLDVFRKLEGLKDEHII